MPNCLTSSEQRSSLKQIVVQRRSSAAPIHRLVRHVRILDAEFDSVDDSSNSAFRQHRSQREFVQRVFLPSSLCQFRRSQRRKTLSSSISFFIGILRKPEVIESPGRNQLIVHLETRPQGSSAFVLLCRLLVWYVH